MVHRRSSGGSASITITAPMTKMFREQIAAQLK
jgi:hypothetical protein